MFNTAVRLKAAYDKQPRYKAEARYLVQLNSLNASSFSRTSVSCFPMALIHYPNGAESRLLDTASIMLSADAIRGTRLTELEPALQKILGDSNTGSRIIEIPSPPDEKVQRAENTEVSSMHILITGNSSNFNATAQGYYTRYATPGDHWRVEKAPPER